MMKKRHFCGSYLGKFDIYGLITVSEAASTDHCSHTFFLESARQNCSCYTLVSLNAAALVGELHKFTSPNNPAFCLSAAFTLFAFFWSQYIQCTGSMSVPSKKLYEFSLFIIHLIFRQCRYRTSNSWIFKHKSSP